VEPCDVTGDGQVTPLDVLTVINDVNSHPGSTAPPAESVLPPPFFDVSGDGQITPQDVLLVINAINSRAAAAGAEAGEGMFAAQVDAAPDILTYPR